MKDNHFIPLIPYIPWDPHLSNANCVATRFRVPLSKRTSPAARSREGSSAGPEKWT